MFPKMGNTFPNDVGKPIDRLVYESEIAAALKRQLGGSHQAIKTVMKWTGVSDRTAKNWLEGDHGPSGEHLIELIRHSDQVVSAVLQLSGRTELQIAADLNDVRDRLLQALQSVDQVIGIESSKQFE